MSRTSARIFLDIILVIFVLEGWWLGVLLFGLVGLWFCSYFLEFVILGIALDSLYNLNFPITWQSHIFVYSSVVIMIVFILLKKIIRKV